MIKPVMHADMGITKAGVARSIKVTQQALDQLQIDLDGNDYLVGNQFSLADIAAAIVLQVTCLPAEYPVPQGPDHGMEYPPAVQAWIEQWQDHPSTKWVQDIYAKHRLSS
jgi:glutathione S-transferase